MQRRSCRAQRIEDEQGRSPLPRQEPVPLFRRHGVRTPGPRQIEGLGGAPVRQGRRDGQSFCNPLTACPTDSWRPPRGLPRPPGRHVRSGGGPGGSPPRRKRRCNTGGPPRLRATPVARDRSVRDRPRLVEGGTPARKRPSRGPAGTMAVRENQRLETPSSDTFRHESPQRLCGPRGRQRHTPTGRRSHPLLTPLPGRVSHEPPSTSAAPGHGPPRLVSYRTHGGSPLTKNHDASARAATGFSGGRQVQC